MDQTSLLLNAYRYANLTLTLREEVQVFLHHSISIQWPLSPVITIQMGQEVPTYLPACHLVVISPCQHRLLQSFCKKLDILGLENHY